MTQIISNNWGWWSWGKLCDFVADVPYECWEWEDRAISWDKVYAEISSLEWEISWKQDALTAWANIDLTCAKVSATNTYIVTESNSCTTYTWEKWVAPYNTSYCYTNICINPASWIKWNEWSIYTFDIDTEMYINPIPSGLVLTGIVVSVSVTALMLSLTVRLYKRYHTLDLDEISARLRKEGL